MKTPKTPVHALKKSIKKYEKLLKKAKLGRMPSYKDISASNCACCVYDKASNHGVVLCDKCLIAQCTGRIDCEDTPWAPLYLCLNAYKGAYGGPPQDVVCGLLKEEARFLKKVLANNT